MTSDGDKYEVGGKDYPELYQNYYPTATVQFDDMGEVSGINGPGNFIKISGPSASLNLVIYSSSSYTVEVQPTVETWSSSSSSWSSSQGNSKVEFPAPVDFDELCFTSDRRITTDCKRCYGCCGRSWLAAMDE